MSSMVTFLPAVTFYKKSKTKQTIALGNRSEPQEDSGVKVTPILLDFGRLLKDSTKLTKEVLRGIPNVDLLHGAASLYGLCLPEITTDIIYPTLCEKWSKTLLMVQDEEQARQKLCRNFLKSLDTRSENTSDAALKARLEISLEEQNKTLEEKEESDHVVNIFSDDESSEDDDDGDDDDFMSGINEFLQRVDARRTLQYEHAREARTLSEESTEVFQPEVGIENRLIAGITFERSYEKPGERILQLTLMAVRKKYQGHRIGDFMMKKLFDTTVTGGSDVIVVNADHNAVEFFEKQGFTDDALLNSRYAHIGDVWFNSKRMCHLPAYAQAMHGHQMEGESLHNFDLREMELEVELWKERSLQSYQAHASIVQRMRREILMLHARVGFQNDVILKLQAELEIKKDSALAEEEKVLRRRVNDLKERMSGFVESSSISEEASHVTSSSAHDLTYGTMSGKTSVDQWSTASPGDEDARFNNVTYCDVTDNKPKPSVKSTASSVTSNVTLNNMSSSSAYDDWMDFTLREIKHCFVTSMNTCDDMFSGTSYDVIDVKNIFPAKLPIELTNRFDDVVKTSHNPDIVANLYYCGFQPIDEDAFFRILEQGFAGTDLVRSEYGEGLHFTRYARCAARFSPTGLILVARVSLGNSQTITPSHPPKQQPPDGYDSILTQGRLASATNSGRRWNLGFSEYIVFRLDQAIPVALISYQFAS